MCVQNIKGKNAEFETVTIGSIKPSIFTTTVTNYLEDPSKFTSTVNMNLAFNTSIACSCTSNPAGEEVTMHGRIGTLLAGVNTVVKISGAFPNTKIPGPKSFPLVIASEASSGLTDVLFTAILVDGTAVFEFIPRTANEYITFFAQFVSFK